MTRAGIRARGRSNVPIDYRHASTYLEHIRNVKICQGLFSTIFGPYLAVPIAGTIEPMEGTDEGRMDGQQGGQQGGQKVGHFWAILPQVYME
jgi:hypothetical protein